jgi:hypothetical protein
MVMLALPVLLVLKESRASKVFKVYLALGILS